MHLVLRIPNLRHAYHSSSWYQHQQSILCDLAYERFFTNLDPVRPYHRIAFFVQSHWIVLTRSLTTLHCAIFDHEMRSLPISDSQAENGQETLYCTRCGITHRIQW